MIDWVAIDFSASMHHVEEERADEHEEARRLPGDGDGDGGDAGR